MAINKNQETIALHDLTLPAIGVWKAARITRISSHGIGLSIDVDVVGPFSKYKRLVVVVSDGARMWAQELTKIEAFAGPRRVRYLATGAGAAILRELYTKGQKTVLISNFVPKE